jgi:hypothetical protein
MLMDTTTEDGILVALEFLETIDALNASPLVIQEAEGLVSEIQQHLLQQPQPGTEMERALYVACVMHGVRFAKARRTRKAVA